MWVFSFGWHHNYLNCSICQMEQSSFSSPCVMFRGISQPPRLASIGQKGRGALLCEEQSFYKTLTGECIPKTLYRQLQSCKGGTVGKMDRIFLFLFYIFCGYTRNRKCVSKRLYFRNKTQEVSGCFHYADRSFDIEVFCAVDTLICSISHEQVKLVSSGRLS